VCCFLLTTAAAQEQKQKDILFTAGHASAFIGGLYDAYYPYSQLKKHGDFGLGAPDKMDGELMVLDGKIYKFQATGKVSELKDTELTPFAVVNFFHADKTVKTTTALNKDKLYAYLDSVLSDKNGIYAIKIKGTFTAVKTRAFPPVSQKPYMPLADMLPLQHFFNFSNVKGTLIGYRLPAFMEGPNISGYHFHLLSDDKKAAGHIIDLMTGDISIEIDTLSRFTVDLPATADFAAFDFTKDRKNEVKRVENGKKD